jgi:ubiquitin-like domain-containing CTD phosphatase 1
MTNPPRCGIATAAMLLASVGSAFDDSSWYKRYPAYPEYCSTLEEMQRRAIPPLQDDDKLGETRLVHVTSVIRHGARTPWGSNLDCWEGYWTDPETGVWDCNLTTFLAPPLREVGVENVYFLFEKQYNALQSPLKNELNGTCQVGQLLDRGFQQELDNGKHLRMAYAYDGTNMDHDVRMRLLDTSGATSPFQQLYYRSDDDQRTIMSGQVLMRGLFEKEFQEHAKTNTTHMIIPLHTADRDVDILTGEGSLCPRLQELEEEAEDSKEYKDYENSEEVQLLRKFMEKELGQVMEDEAIDCIMTTICTDRPLPEALDDYGRNTSKYHDTYGDNLLKRVYESVSDTEVGRTEIVLHQISHAFL